VAAPAASHLRPPALRTSCLEPRVSVLRFRIVVPVLVTLAACAAPARDAVRRSGAFVDVDDFGDTLRVPATPPARVVSLNPTTTEIVFAIGAGSRLVGRSHWDSWPDSARFVPDLGPAVRPNVETVIAARPDLVLLYASADDRPAAARLRDAGIPVAALRIDRVADFRRAVRDLGALLGDSIRAAAVVDSVSATLERVRAATAPLPKVSVFMVAWENPIITIGRGSFLDTLLEIAGARNVYHDFAAASPTVTLEDVVARDPDVVLASPDSRRRLLADPRWRAVRAVRAGRVLAFDTTVVGRPSVVMGMAAVSLARLLHPGSLP
jgi:iron complex transport system substrate-binding protein